MGNELTQATLELDENKTYQVGHSYGRVADGLKAMYEILLNAVKFLRAMNDEPILMQQIHLPLQITIDRFTLHIDVTYNEKK